MNTLLGLFIIVSLHCKFCYGLTQEKKLFEIFPDNNVQLLKILNEVSLRKEIVLWNGVSENNDTPLQLLASTNDFNVFASSFLLPLGLTFSIADQNVTINFSSTQSLPKLDVKPIPGTSLFTGIFYKLTNKKFPSGKVTYTSETSEHEANFLQIDIDPQQTVFYNNGEKWYNEDQWVLIEAPDAPGWYELRNKVIFDGITTWSYAKIGGGYHIIVSRKKADVRHLSPGGQWRVHALWKPIQMKDEDNYYKLQNKNFLTGTITWTEKKYRGVSHYIQVDVKPEHVGNYYEPGGKWYDDALFSFASVDVKLQALISSVEYDQGEIEIKNTTRDTYEHIYTVHNPSNESSISRNITEVFHDKIKMKLGFDSPFNTSYEGVKFRVKLEGSDPEFLKVDQEVNFEEGRFSPLNINRELILRKEVEVRAGGITKVFAYSKWISEDIPIKVIMEIKGSVDDGQEFSSYAIREYLGDGFRQYEIDNKEEEETNSIKIRVPGVLEKGYWLRSLESEEFETSENVCP